MTMKRWWAAAVAVGLAVSGCAGGAARSADGAASASGSASASDSPTASAAASSTPTPSPEPARDVTLTVSGDLLWHNTTWFSAAEDAKGSQQRNFAPVFGSVGPVISGADLSICHEEVPIAPPGTSPQNYPTFAAPREVAKGIADAGFDACTTASNHSWDQGFAGVKATLDGLDAAKVAHVGTARSAQEAERPVVLTAANGVQVGLVTGAYGLNGLSLPADKKWAWNPTNVDQLLSRAKAARQAGADIVMVAIHTGDEYEPGPSKEQKALAERLTASPDVDLVYSHHTHVVGPWTKVNGKWVVYGLGNLVAQQREHPSQEGVVGRFTFRVQPGQPASVTKAEYVPTYIPTYSHGDPIRLVRINSEIGKATGQRRERLQEALKRTRSRVKLLGATGMVES